MIWEIDDRKRAIEGLDENGRPDPGYARSLGLLPARTGPRVLAAVLEWSLAVLIALPAVVFVVPVVVQATSDGFDPAAFLQRSDLVWIIVAVAASNGLITAYTIVQLVLHGRKGVTLGKAIVGIRSVNVRTLERPGFWRGAVVRYLVACASFAVPLVGPLFVIALSPFFDGERRGRGWLDLAAATWFVDTRRGLNPYDEKRMRIARKRLNTPERAEKRPLPSLSTSVAPGAAAPYTPGARLSGGVLGAHRVPAEPAVRTATSGAGALATPLVASAAPPAFPAQAPGPRPSAPSAPAPAHAPVPSPATRVQNGVRAVLVLDTGEPLEVRGVTLIGRDPSAAAGESVTRTVPLADDTLTVSKTHLAIVPARRGVFVVDRASTNGSAIVRADTEVPLAAGEPAELHVGDTVRFGDRSLTVAQL
ncbi:hypothetical protein GCM10027416_32390 [Okibacterium endophyticum]